MKPFADLEPKEYDVLLNVLYQPVLLKIGINKELYQDREHSSIFISGSKQEINKKLQELDKEAFYFCYSMDGTLGGKVCEKLAELGMSRPTNLKGGINAWEKTFNTL